MLKFKRVYICDSCGEIKLPSVYFTPCGARVIKLPNGWKKIGRLHMCDLCAGAFLVNVPHIKQNEKN